jgi:hypothetical protein
LFLENYASALDFTTSQRRNYSIGPCFRYYNLHLSSCLCPMHRIVPLKKWVTRKLYHIEGCVSTSFFVSELVHSLELNVSRVKHMFMFDIYTTSTHIIIFNYVILKKLLLVSIYQYQYCGRPPVYMWFIEWKWLRHYLQKRLGTDTETERTCFFFPHFLFLFYGWLIILIVNFACAWERDGKKGELSSDFDERERRKEDEKVQKILFTFLQFYMLSCFLHMRCKIKHR